MDKIGRLVRGGPFLLTVSLALITMVTGCSDQLSDKSNTGIPGIDGINSSKKPVIQSFTVEPEIVSPNKAVLVKVTASDQDSDELTYIFAAEGSVNATASQNTVFWTPPALPGKYAISATITDKVNMVFAQKEVIVTTNSTPAKPSEPTPNQAPTITTLFFSTTSVEPGKSIMVTTGASDPDGDPLTYTFSAEGTITNSSMPHVAQWTPPLQPGPYTLSVTVTDGSHTVIKSGQVTVTAPAEPPERLRAFPGAQGYGAYSAGGRGGRIIEVTNLNDSGTGSLRAALEASGSRIVVFRVGGVIRLTKAINVRNPYVTVAAQTAPGDGVCLRGAGITVLTHNVIIRGLRIRAGDASEGPPKDQRDNLQILGSSSSKVNNVIVDHCSFSWGTDENVSMGYGVSDITVQWCIVSEGLYNAGHPEGNHSAGFLVAEQSDRISVHHNLMAHNDWRNPLFKGDATGEVIGNLVYNWGWEGCRFTDDKNTDPVLADVRDNYYQKGAAMKKTYGVDISSSIDSGSRIFLEGNIGPTRLNDSLDNWLITNGDKRFRASSPFVSQTDVTLRSAVDNRRLVLDNAGAIAPARDSVDQRIVSDVINNRGNLINSQNNVGGWPIYRNGAAPDDTDHDGMPDAWEQARGLNINNAADRNTTAPSGYTWVEEYLNSLIMLP